MGDPEEGRSETPRQARGDTEAPAEGEEASPARRLPSPDEADETAKEAAEKMERLEGRVEAASNEVDKRHSGSGYSG